VPARQLQLFKHAKPLLKIFDQGFFRSVPRSPGVYIMTGRSDRVLYVGQSGNLRQRLATYKNCNPHQLPRRIVRLINEVEKISWETCETSRHARVRENELLRLHRPKFNVANVYPKAYAFIGVKVRQRTLTLWLTCERANSGGLYGAFKGFSLYGFAALGRSLWAAQNQPVSIHNFPCGMFSEKPKRQWALNFAAQDTAAKAHLLVGEFLAGTSLQILDWLQQCLPTAVHPFQQQLHTTDLAVLSEFFRIGPQRNYRLRQENGLESHLILQDSLDDFIAMSRPVVMA